jgi:hypothetical protein
MRTTTISRQYSDSASRAGDAVEKAINLWTRGVRQVTDRTRVRPKLPQVDLVPPVERYFDFVQRTVEDNRGRTVRWAKSVTALSEAMRQRAESVGVLARSKAGAVEQAAREESARAAKVARQQAEETERSDQERAREARLIERDRSRKVHQRARQRYQGMTKAELSDLLEKRNLPKTGSRDELVGRLAEADAR